ncbi:MAG: hypothetical protein EOP19_02000, partial [Hyphomicrobiales bacterium]
MALLALIPLDASAHHKPGHNPPGQQKKAAIQHKVPFVIERLEGSGELNLTFRTEREVVTTLPSTSRSNDLAWAS